MWIITPTKNPNSPNKKNPLKLKPFTLQIHSIYQWSREMGKGDGDGEISRKRVSDVQ